jgi:ABC-2 type transport system permease protein
MKKYWTSFKTSYQENITYRGSVFIRAIRDVLLTLFFVVLWGVLFQQKSVIGGYTFNSMVTYYILVRLMDQLYSFQTTRLLNEDIVSGDLSNYLSRPIKYTYYLMAYVLGRRIARTTITFLLVVFVFIFFNSYIALPPSLFNIAIFIPFAILSWLLFFEIAFILGVISFWFSEASDLRSILEHVILILGGLWIPLDLFPKNVEAILNLLPFKYLYGSLVQIYQGRLTNSELVTMFAIESLWVLFFHFFSQRLFAKGLRNYASFGK